MYIWLTCTIVVYVIDLLLQIYIAITMQRKVHKVLYKQSCVLVVKHILRSWWSCCNMSIDTASSPYAFEHDLWFHVMVVGSQGLDQCRMLCTLSTFDLNTFNGFCFFSWPVSVRCMTMCHGGWFPGFWPVQNLLHSQHIWLRYSINSTSPDLFQQDLWSYIMVCGSQGFDQCSLFLQNHQLLYWYHPVKVLIWNCICV